MSERRRSATGTGRDRLPARGARGEGGGLSGMESLRRCGLPSSVGTAVLVLLVLAALWPASALAQQGVAVGPYWEAELEGAVTALAVGDVEGECTADAAGCGWAEIIAGTATGQVILFRAAGERAWTFDVEDDWVTGVSTGDLDGDGSPEVFATAAGILPTSTLYVLRADGQLLWSHAVRDELWRVVLFDLDGDGSRDVLLAAQRPAVLDAAGSELAGWPVDPLRTPHVVVTDTDADSADELVAVGETDVTILEAGGGMRAWPHGLVDPIRVAASGDLDQDGRVEIILATETALARFDGEGRPAWTRAWEEPLADGWMDDAPGLLAAVGGTVAWLTADGSEAWRFRFSPRSPSAVFGLHAADPDADGAFETAFGTADGQVYLLDGDGAALAEYGVGDAAHLVRYADLNGDGRGEVLVGAGGVLSVFGSPTGVRSTAQRWTYAARGAVTALTTADVDGDGRWEVVVGSRDQKVTLLDKEGSMLWQFAASDVIDGLDAGGAGEILVRAGRHLYLLAPEGVLLWQQRFESPVQSADLGRDTTAGTVSGPSAAESEPGQPSVAVGLEDGRALLLRAEDGRVSRSHQFDRAVSAVGLSATWPGMIVGLGDGRVLGLAGDGRRLWEQDIGRIVTWVAIADLDRDGREDALIRSGDSVYRLQLEDGSLIWQVNTQAERLTGAAVGDAVVVGTDRRVFGLDATGTQSWSHPLDEVASVVYAADLDAPCEVNPSDCGAVETMVGTVKGGFLVLDAAGQLVWQGRGRERVNALQAADLNGDGQKELLIGTEDGEVRAYGLVVNQVPWLSSPQVVPVGDGYVYSVRVRDPDGDAVPVTLELYDPSARAWRAQDELTAEGGEGTLSWNLTNPFDTWDAGRDSQFRFVWNDGQTRRTVAAVAGPLDIPISPWYLFYGRYVLAAAVIAAVPVLLLVMVRRARTYRRSPVGQAEGFLLRLTLEPEALLIALHQLAADERRMTAILPHLPGLARQAGQEMVAGLAEGTYLILTRPDAPGVMEGLKTVAGALAGEAPVPPAEGWHEAQQVYALLLAALQADRVAGLVSLGARLEDAGHSLEGSEGFLSDLAPLLLQLGQVGRTLGYVERVESSADKIAYLAEALEGLGRCDREARSRLAGPERNILIHVIANWLAVVTGALSSLQGRAQLELTLKTRRAVAVGEQIVLVLAVDNVGRSPASNLAIELLPGEGYAVDGEPAVVAALPAGRTADVELRARPSPALDTFRAEFRVTFDDRERSGKTELFADRVRLVAPPAVFQPIPNPYATGKPLRPGSPVFVGREDVFAFMEENLGGAGGESVLILIGERRMGKTSILRQLPLRLGERFVPVFIDGQAVGITPGLGSLFYDLGLEVQRSLAERGMEVTLPPLAAFEARPTDAFERSLLAEAQAALGTQRLLFLLDEFEELEARVRSGDLEVTVFPYLRHVMQHLEGVGFVFAGTHRLEELTADYWSILFNIALYKRVGLLDAEAARRLISQPVAGHGLVYDDLAVDKMIKATGGHPHFLQLLCHTVVNIHNRERVSYVTVGDVNRALEEMLELGEAHLAFLWERATPWERAILAALARQVSAGEAGTAGAVASLLADAGLPADVVDVAHGLQQLVAQELLQRAGEAADRYEFQVDLVRQWLERYKSLAQAVQAAAGHERP